MDNIFQLLLAKISERSTIEKVRHKYDQVMIIITVKKCIREKGHVSVIKKSIDWVPGGCPQRERLVPKTQKR